ncbi:helix-turn-helix transcriptional regulator [Chromatocurvus halotolerans]|uniref:Regulatory LuxR family protein n=1 Tax=Chromatocurvus halotolerans TaxID=1132028 RepID=A0A4R2KP41_9GAMM|nr:helix-turn-helix transcriptional regulator [Chromatocurvus halotolerans]TCO75483.1 regulatory LuxR family protein [Chromatocurvus halotolerans]
MSRRARPRLRDVRRAYHLLGECLEHREDSTAWRAHLLTGLQAMTGARVALYLHVDAPLSAVEQVSETLASGFLDAREQALWAHYQATEAHRDDLFHRGFYTRAGGSSRLVTRSLYDVVERSAWQRSRHYGDYVAACGLGDRITSSLSLPTAGPRCEQTLVLHRDAGDGAFPAPARYLVRLVHHGLSELQGRLLTLPGTREDLAGLTPRMREVLMGLLAGESEKQIASRLGLSRHTVNRHVQRVYRHYDVTSRGRLLAKLRSGGGVQSLSPR